MTALFISVFRRRQPLALAAALCAVLALAPIAAGSVRAAGRRHVAHAAGGRRHVAHAAGGPVAAASELYVRGGGDGHGIGLSQYGAYGYALHGESYRFILAHYYQGTAIGATDPNQIVRVLLATGSAAFSGASAAGGKRLNPTITYTVRALADGSLVLLRPSGKRMGRFPAPLTITGPGPLLVAGLGSYHGSLEFRPDGAGHVETVNAVDLEDYIRGVVAAEMPASWAIQALEAQAVAARTYAITTDAGGTAFDQYSDTRSQVYRGIAAETPATDAAIAATRGQIVTYHGEAAVTYFFASSGGYTENVENAWPGATPEPWLRGVPDPYDGAGSDPDHRWGLQLTTASAAAKLGRLVRGTLTGIAVTRHGVSPRIITADVVGAKGDSTVSGSQLQRAFGLLSTYASFTTISSSVQWQLPPAAGDSPPPQGFMAALMPLLRAIVSGKAPMITGSVFPARTGDQLAVQSESHGRWRTFGHVTLGGHGTYSLQLPGPGTYRVVDGALNGPVVTLG